MSFTSFTESEVARFRPSDEVDTDDPEELRTFLQFNNKNVGNEKLSVLIISTQSFCEQTKKVMMEIVSEKYNGNILIKLAESIDQILLSGISSTTVDYIVIVFDASRKNNVEKLKKEILKVESSYVAVRRLTLVNGAAKDGIKGVDLEIAELSQQYNLLHLNGDVKNSESCKRLCERILELVTTSCGHKGGVPFILPTAMDVFRQLFT